MKILAISDEETAALWEGYVPGRLDGYDLIISCGDLKPKYLEFLVTMARVSLLYVHGNHDARYLHEPPEGCDCIDDSLVVYQGLRILGLGGCKKYHPGEFQYTEEQMRLRIARLRFALWRAGGVDLVVTHAPPRGVGDQEDFAHQGFEALRDLLDKYHPQVLIHGHVHLRYNISLPREQTYSGVRVINVSGRYALDMPDKPFPERDRGRILWKTHHREPPDDQEIARTPFRRE